MARDENPPFLPGETYFGGASVSSDDITNTTYLEGKEWVFEDIDYSVQGSKTLRSGRKVRRRIVRNVAAGALLPKTLVIFQATAGVYDTRVDGAAKVDDVRSFPVDEFLPAAGVAVNDLFWIVVEGPAMCLTGLEAAAATAVSVADIVSALTTSSSTGGTTAGRIITAAFTGATAVLAKQVASRVGFALSAKTSGNTNADILIDVGKW